MYVLGKGRLILYFCQEKQLQVFVAGIENIFVPKKTPCNHMWLQTASGNYLLTTNNCNPDFLARFSEILKNKNLE